MQRLILLRHASAEARASTGEDIDRALAAEGRADAALMAKVLNEEGLVPDVALVSGARRTRETWACLAPVFPAARAVVVADLYNATAEEVLAEVQEAAEGCQTLLVIGHNPGLHELAIELLHEGAASAYEVERVAAKFPTCTAVAFEFDLAGRPAPGGVFHVADYGGAGA